MTFVLAAYRDAKALPSWPRPMARRFLYWLIGSVIDYALNSNCRSFIMLHSIEAGVQAGRQAAWDLACHNEGI